MFWQGTVRDIPPKASVSPALKWKLPMCLQAAPTTSNPDTVGPYLLPQALQARACSQASARMLLPAVPAAQRSQSLTRQVSPSGSLLSQREAGPASAVSAWLERGEELRHGQSVDQALCTQRGTPHRTRTNGNKSVRGDKEGRGEEGERKNERKRGKKEGRRNSKKRWVGQRG